MIKIGDIFKTNQGYSVIVIEIKNLKNITVQFIDKHSYITTVQQGSLKSGGIRNPYFKSVRGVGFLGVGDFKTHINRKATREYAAWIGMFNRCYSKSSDNPTYKGCSVASEWHNFQDFAEWYTNHRFYGLGYHLDKDLLVRGNKVYSSEFCDLVPVEVNSLTLDRRSDRGDYPIGVSFVGNRGVFTSKLRINGKTKNLGDYATASEAHSAYVVEKEANVKRMASVYKERISERVFNALIDWKVMA